MPHFRTSSYNNHEFFKGRHRFEHWYRDNSVYFITSKVRDGAHAFKSPEARAIFWDRFTHYANKYGFVPWVTTLLHNHYHTEGYLRDGSNLGTMMQRIHGSIAKLVNDLLPERIVPFWRHRNHHDYFDGCIRDVLQANRAYRYTLLQAVRAKLVSRWEDYPDTHVNVRMEPAITRAVELNAFLEKIPYARYERRRRR